MKFFSLKSLFPVLAEAETRFPDDRPATMSGVLSFLFKRSAKHLRTHLHTRHGVSLSHAQALDAVSASVGCADWNTAHAFLHRTSHEDLASSEMLAPASVGKMSGPELLSRQLDFSVSSLVIGPAGTGKTCGVLFALQQSRAFEKGRPVMIVRTAELTQHQPNWGNAVGHLPSVVTLESLGRAKPAAADDCLVVIPSEDFSDSIKRGEYQADMVARMLVWLKRREHLNPLVLVDDAPHVLGEQVSTFLQELPGTVTLIWLAQSLGDFKDLSLVRARFNRVHQMFQRSVGPLMEQLVGAHQVKRAEPLVSRLKLGEAISMPFSLPALTPSMRQAVQAAFLQVLPCLRVAHTDLPRGQAPDTWVVGSRVYVLETRLQERVLSMLPEQVRAQLARLHNPDMRLSVVTTCLLEVLESTGLLVRQHEGTVLPIAEALWTMKIGAVPYKGVLVLEVPLELQQALPQSPVVPALTGPLYDAAAPNKRSRFLAQ